MKANTAGSTPQLAKDCNAENAMPWVLGLTQASTHIYANVHQVGVRLRTTRMASTDNRFLSFEELHAPHQIGVDPVVAKRRRELDTHLDHMMQGVKKTRSISERMCHLQGHLHQLQEAVACLVGHTQPGVGGDHYYAQGPAPNECDDWLLSVDPTAQTPTKPPWGESSIDEGDAESAQKLQKLKHGNVMHRNLITDIMSSGWAPGVRVGAQSTMARWATCGSLHQLCCDWFHLVDDKLTMMVDREMRCAKHHRHPRAPGANGENPEKDILDEIVDILGEALGHGNAVFALLKNFAANFEKGSEEAFKNLQQVTQSIVESVQSEFGTRALSEAQKKLESGMKESKTIQALMLLLQEYSDSVKNLKYVTNDKQYAETFGNYIDKMKQTIVGLETMAVYMERMHNSFVLGIEQISGIRPARDQDFQQSGITQSIMKFLSTMIELAKKLSDGAPSNYEMTSASSETLGEHNGSPSEGDGTRDLHGEWTTEMKTNAATLQQQIAKELFNDAISKPVLLAANRVFSDIHNRYPHLQDRHLTVDVMMDVNRNSLYTQFQRLVGLDYALCRRMNGTRVTYASDYNRYSNQYRTTIYCFKFSKLVLGKGKAAYLTTSGIGGVPLDTSEAAIAQMSVAVGAELHHVSSFQNRTEIIKSRLEPVH